MVAPSAVLLPKVFPAEAVTLGQLVRNPLVPNVNSYFGGCALLEDSDVITAEPENDYSTIVATDTRGRFEVGLMRLLGGRLHGRRADLLSVKAAALEYCSLRDTGALFRRICAANDAQTWIADMVRNKAPCYMVIGIQSLREAEFKRAVLREGGAGGYVTLPLEATAQVPFTIGGGLEVQRIGGSSAQKVSGVFGIEVQRLDPHIGPAGELGLKSEVSWHWTYQRVKGNGGQAQQEKMLSISLVEVEVGELVELLQADELEDKQDDEDDD